MASELCVWFLETYPTYFVSPLCLSGSSVESLFSQYKHSSGGKLDSVNYATSRAAHLVKQSVSTHHSGKEYRDQLLDTVEIPRNNFTDMQAQPHQPMTTGVPHELTGNFDLIKDQSAISLGPLVSLASYMILP